MTVLAGPSERELHHMGLAHDDTELAAQRRDQRAIPLPRISYQPPPEAPLTYYAEPCRASRYSSYRPRWRARYSKLAGRRNSSLRE